MSKIIPVLLLAFGAGFAGFAAADADPSLPQVYQAANSGHLDQAQSMMAQVLKDHPNSAKAHYVEAELDARQGKFAAAREELQSAERLEPGLPFAKPDAVGALRAELYPQQRSAPAAGAMPVPVAVAHGGGFPWGAAIGIALVVAIIWMLFRRRQQVMMSSYGGPAPGAPYGGGYGGGYPGGYPPGGGPGLLGSLGTGLAVGAGVVAGEELAHRLLDGNGNRIEGGEQVVYRDPPPGNPNADMGGSNFGVNDSSSWDDNSGGDFSGGGSDDSWS